MEKYLINKMYNVKDAGAHREFSRGERREDYADAWNETGNVVLVGLPGSGKGELARLLAQKTARPEVRPTTPGQAVEVLTGKGRIIVLEDQLVRDESVVPLIHQSGKVFYLMADSRLLASRMVDRQGGDQEEIWRDLSARLAVMEPVYYGVLHFILQGVNAPEDLVEDAMEKIGY